MAGVEIVPPPEGEADSSAVLRNDNPEEVVGVASEGDVVAWVDAAKEAVAIAAAARGSTLMERSS